jgi:hypothetical protein
MLRDLPSDDIKHTRISYKVFVSKHLQCFGVIRGHKQYLNYRSKPLYARMADQLQNICKEAVLSYNVQGNNVGTLVEMRRAENCRIPARHLH